ncbi:unnamed protein product [Angiostrongylus costaricensis]|uniref:Uncharacterized protein n=1 Tax=Angiostrongylus costaricensis TaxID=334426 RepID=A0A0R3PHH9_ANGCS|nr:unnamed protein product [Angiostrongylus costaricensis]
MAPIEEFLLDDEIQQINKIIKDNGAVIINVLTLKKDIKEADRVLFVYSRRFPSCYFMEFAKFNKMLFCSKKEKNSWLDNRDELYDRYVMIDEKLQFNLVDEAQRNSKKNGRKLDE